jgi:hypothetical protein
MLHNTTPYPIHSSFYITFNLVPIGSAFRELVDFLHAPDSVETVGVGDDGCQFLRVGWINEIDLGKLSECLEIEEEFAVP